MTLYIIGGGIAGLAAALKASEHGIHVIMLESAKTFGGRCRSHYVASLEQEIDNGTHVIIKANTAVQRYLHSIGQQHALRPLGRALNFISASGKPHCYTLPFAFADKTFLRLLYAPADATVADCTDALHWHSLCEAILNTPPAQASARLLRNTLLRGMAGGLSLATFQPNLQQVLINPAVTILQQRGCILHTQARVKAVSADTLYLHDATLQLQADDRIIVALPYPNAQRLLPQLAELPYQESALTNVHFAGNHILEGLWSLDMWWLYQRDGILSVSASGSYPQATFPITCWQRLSTCFKLNHALLPPHHIVCEKRATPMQTPAWHQARQQFKHMLPSRITLAGDWTQSHLPATLEAAIRSGWCAVSAI